MNFPFREDYLKTLDEICRDEIVVTCLGMATHQWNRLKPKPSNFHLADSMGQAIPLAAGIAMALPEHRVVVMEGDGGLLMNLGCLATTADLALDNLLILLFDNRKYEASGNQPLPGGHADFAALARAAGIPNAISVEKISNFKEPAQEALTQKGTTFFCLKTREEGDLTFPPYRDHPWEVAARFRQWSKSQRE